MSRYISGKCLNAKCARHEQTWSCAVIGFDPQGNRMLICDECNSSITSGPPAKVPKKKRSWPYYNDSIGMTLESESHEMKIVKENNLEAV